MRWSEELGWLLKDDRGFERIRIAGKLYYVGLYATVIEMMLVV